MTVMILAIRGFWSRQATSEAPGRCLVGAGDARWKRWFRFDVGGHNQNFSDGLFYGFIWCIYRMGLCLYGMVYLKLLFLCHGFCLKKWYIYIYMYIYTQYIVYGLKIRGNPLVYPLEPATFEYQGVRTDYFAAERSINRYAKSTYRCVGTYVYIYIYIST